MRTVATTGAALLGPQDFLWWVTMMRNDHTMAAAGASIVRLPQKPEYTVGTVVDVAHDTLNTTARYGIFGVVVANVQGFSLIKILGPAQVRWATPPTEVGMLAVMNGSGACNAMPADSKVGMRSILGVALEVPVSSMGLIAIGNPGFGTQSSTGISFDGGRPWRVACCTVDLQTLVYDTSHAFTGIKGTSAERPLSGACAYAYGVTGGTIVIRFADGLFSEKPMTRASLENVSKGMVVYGGDCSNATYAHLEFRCRETINTTAISGKLHVFAVGPGA